MQLYDLKSQLFDDLTIQETRRPKIF